MASVETGRLLAELQEKEHKLIQAAGYGRDLLEENAKLKQELQILQQDSTRMEEVELSQAHLKG